jgi:translocation protein SEC72
MDTFTQLPIAIDPQTKAISVTTSTASSDLKSDLNALNSLHKVFLQLEGPVPPPPVPVNPKRSAQIQKLRESGNTFYRKGQYVEAIRMYNFAVEMALGRPPWEPSALAREELSILYSNRAQAHMSLQSWPEAMVDADLSVELKAQGNGKSWYRKGKCLLEMGRLDEARSWVGRALEYEGRDAELLGLLKEIDTALTTRTAS